MSGFLINGAAIRMNPIAISTGDGFNSLRVSWPYVLQANIHRILKIN
jgi:hypothetical protein